MATAAFLNIHLLCPFPPGYSPYISPHPPPEKQLVTLAVAQSRSPVSLSEFSLSVTNRSLPGRVSAPVLLQVFLAVCKTPLGFLQTSPVAAFAVSQRNIL